jgi:hypothetical protein
MIVLFQRLDLKYAGFYYLTFKVKTQLAIDVKKRLYAD